MAELPSDLAFTPAVKAVQERRGSRKVYGRTERGHWPTVVTPELAAFVAAVDTAYFGTATAAGQPYIQHRGGPKGFIRVLDEHTLAFVDYAGNRQYVSTGNLAENDRAFLFLMDYAQRHRVKIWGRARIVESDAELTARLMPADYKARPEQVIVFSIEAWDTNCSQHIPQKFDAAPVAAALQELQARIERLEAENAELRAFLGKPLSQSEERS